MGVAVSRGAPFGFLLFVVLEGVLRLLDDLGALLRDGDFALGQFLCCGKA